VTSPAPPLVELLGKPDCHLCEDAKHLLRSLQATHAFILHEINIVEHAAGYAQYRDEIPVVFINGRKAFKYRIDPAQFVRRLQRAQQAEPPAWRLWRWRQQP
jgi:glutaredoxin